MFTSVNLKRQFGLGPDPRRHDLVAATKRTPTLVRAREHLDSEQPGFPVFHRHIASPFPLGLLAIGASLFLVGLVLVHARGMQTTTIYYTVALPYGGLGSLLSGLWFFPQGNTIGTTLFGVLGGVLIAISLPNLPWAGIETAYLTSASNLLVGLNNLEQAIGLVVLVAFVIAFMLVIASARTSLPICFSIFLIALSLILYGVGTLHGKNSLNVGAGWLFMVVAMILYYAAAANILADEGFNVLPVMPLPHCDE